MSETGVHSEEYATDFGARIAAVLARHRPDPTRLIPLLQDVQREFDYLLEEAMREVARHLGIAETRVYGVATFYSQFTLTPRGENVITVCNGTACHVRGGDKILEDLSRTLGTKPGETTPDGWGRKQSDLRGDTRTRAGGVGRASARWPRPDRRGDDGRGLRRRPAGALHHG